jgi:hypothetical protein
MSANQKTSKRAQAIEAFGELPAEVLALGKPESVHPPTTSARIGARLQTQFSADGPAARKVAVVLAVGLPLLGAGFLIPYFKGVPFGKAPPVGWLSVTGAGVLFGLMAAGWLWHLLRTPRVERPEPAGEPALPGLILYPDAVVHVCGGKFTVIRWDDVDQLDAPASAKCWRLLARDGTQIDVPYWIKDEGTAVETIHDRVTDALLPRYLQQIEEGKKVMFGPFGVSKRHVYYKQKKLAWDDVTSMKLLTGAAVGLQIRSGGLLPWCTYHLMAAPNGCVAYKVLPRVAPSRLLTPG